jgi:hypothetical protein
MRFFNWKVSFIRGFEVTTNEMGWLEKGKVFAINCKLLKLYIIFEYLQK